MRTPSSFLVVGVVLSALLCSCQSGTQGSSNPAFLVQRANDEEGVFGAPDPDSVLAGLTRTRTPSAAQLVRTGSDYIPGQAQRVTVEEPDLRYSPVWQDSSLSFGDTAYAIYQFNLENVTGTSALQLSWTQPPADFANLWLGLSLWQTGSWEWHPGPADGSFDFGAKGTAPYTHPTSGDLLVTVLLLGTDEATLHELALDGNVPPVAQLTANPTAGVAPFTVTFDASGSHDPFGTITNYEWDWNGEGNGPWDEDGTSPTVEHEYSDIGRHTAWVRVTDDGGAFSTASVTILVSGTPGAGDWWMFGHDPQHTRRSPFTGPASAAVKWSFGTQSIVESSAAVAADGTIFIGGYDGNLYALFSDGSFKWAFTTGGGVVSSPAVAVDGTVYVGSLDHLLYAINPNGTLKWSFPTEGSIYSSPAIADDGTVYFGSDDTYLYAVNPNGTLKWAYATEGVVESSPAIGSDGTVYVGSYDYSLHAVNANGTVKWTFPTAAGIASSPAVAPDGTIYFGNDDFRLIAVNPNGTLKWFYTAEDSIESSPAIAADGTVYVGSYDGKLYAVSALGSLKWSYPTGSSIRCSPAIGGDGTVYFGSYDYDFYALNPSGSLKWTEVFGDGPPSIGPDGTVYVGSADGKLYAIGPGAAGP